MSIISFMIIISDYYATEGSSFLELLQTSRSDLVDLIVSFFPGTLDNVNVCYHYGVGFFNEFKLRKK